MPPGMNGIEIRNRAGEFVGTDFQGRSDVGTALRKAIADVFGILLPETVIIPVSSIGGWQNWPQVPMRGLDVKLTTPGLLPILSGHKICAMWIG